MTAPPRVALASLEPEPEDFRHRNAAGLCIDCGERPQPPRRDGEPGTHHRCDRCRETYDRRTELRRVLCDTDRLTYVAGVPDARCSRCGEPIEIRAFHYAYAVPESAHMVRRICYDCATDARFRIAPATAVARVDLFPVNSGNGGPVFLAITVPVGVPALFAMGVSFVSWAWQRTEGGIQGGVMYRAEDEHVTIKIDPIEGDRDGVRFMAVLARQIAATAAAIHVPKDWRRLVRAELYDAGLRGRQAARRLHGY